MKRRGSAPLKNRGWTEIAAAVLYSATDGPATRTKIMYSAFLSYKQTVEYLAELAEGGLVEPYADQLHFKTSEKGLQFLAAFESVYEMMPQSRKTNNRFLNGKRC